MGYLTTITIYNDGCDQIPKNAQDFADKVKDACSGIYTRGGINRPAGEFGVGNHCNLVTVQHPRHADDHTVYVHAGNTVVEMNVFSQETAELLEKHPAFFDTLLGEMELQVKELKQLKKKKQDENELN